MAFDIQMIEKPPKRNNKRKEDQILRSMQVQITGQQLGNDDIFQKIVESIQENIVNIFQTRKSTQDNIKNQFLN